MQMGSRFAFRAVERRFSTGGGDLMNAAPLGPLAFDGEAGSDAFGVPRLPCSVALVRQGELARGEGAAVRPLLAAGRRRRRPCAGRADGGLLDGSLQCRGSL